LLRSTSFTARDLCLIIEACKTHAVAELKFGDLEIRWTPGLSPLPLAYPSSVESIPEAAISATQTKVAEHALEQDEVLMRQEQLEHLKITDPLAYERLMMSGEFGDDGSESEEDA
jgi:hypothetical protein